MWSFPSGVIALRATTAHPRGSQSGKTGVGEGQALGSIFFWIQPMARGSQSGFTAALM
jgi:hypothetical protein